METVVQFITNVGFPIACCVALGWYVKYITDKHEREIEKLKQSLDNNTRVITELVLYLRGDKS